MNLNQLKKYYSQSPLFLRKIYSKIPWSVRMGKEYRKTFNFLQQSLYWTKKDWNDYQTLKLKELLVYCYDTVPYYQKLFNELNINPHRPDIWKEFYKIPFITKDIVTTNLTDFIPDGSGKRKFYNATTGGTTGKPMQTFYDSASYSKEWAFKIFFWNLAIGYTPKDKKATFRGVQFENTLYIENPIYNEMRFSPFHLDEKNIEKFVKKLLEYNPKYIHGYPSAIEQLAFYFLKQNLSIKELKGIILISENIYPHQKELIKKAFYTSVYSFYGHSERLIFASMGPELDSYYAHPSYGITELINESGYTLSENNILGELVGTGFINKGMPLLRYKTGDYSCWKEPSGKIQMPALGEVKGRWAQEYLVGSKGKTVSLTALNMHSDVYSKIKQMQYIQDKPGIVKLNIVKEAEFTEKDENYIRNEYLKKLGGQFDLVFTYVSELEKTQAGKTRFLIQNIK